MAPERAGISALLLALVACSPDPGGQPAVAAAADASVTALASGGDRSYASFSHVCAVVDANLQCWGAGGAGQLADFLLATRRPLPMRLAGLHDVSGVAAGGTHSCAVAGGGVSCWGKNESRQLGVEDVAIAVEPREVRGLPRPVSLVAAGLRHTCAVAGGDLWCWGRSRAGELGGTPGGRCSALRGPVSCSSTPIRVEGLAGEPGAVALGDAHTCASVGDAVLCWGANDRGQLGDGGGADRARPQPVEGLRGPIGALAASGAHTCAVAAGEVHCWGANEAGQLGDGSRSDRRRPVRVELPGEASAVAAGRRHACAIASGRVHCWGDGAGSAAGPVEVRGLGGVATAVAAGADVSCAVVDGARVVCWGDDDFGQLGRGRGSGRGPVTVGPWDDGRIRDVDRDGRIVVVCLGDSNTERRGSPPESWCDSLGELLGDRGWVTVNRGLGGATASDASLRPARMQLEYALANDAPDVVIAAFGTNDLLQDVEVERIGAAYGALWRRAAEDGVTFFAALTPPAMPETHPLNAKVAKLNGLLRSFIPSERLIDFASGYAAADFADAVHLGPSGQARRARAAWDALRAAGAPR